MLKLLENTDKQTEEAETISAGARIGKDQVVINLGDGSEQTKSGLVYNKRSLDEHEDDRVVALKRRVDVVMETPVDLPDPSNDLFNQLLGSQVPQPPDSQSVWSFSFLLGQAPGESFHCGSDADLHRKLTRSQVANVAKALSLRLASLASFSMLDVSFSESKMNSLEMENQYLKQKIAEDVQLMIEFVKTTKENELLKSDLLSKIENLKSTQAVVTKLDEEKSGLLAEKVSLEKKVSKLAADVDYWSVFSARQLKKGFNALAKQISCVHPGFDLSHFDLGKKVREWQLVEILDDNEVAENEETENEEQRNASVN